jgi:uncharacterized GH25 family protein
MKRTFAVVGLLVLAGSAPAHFVYIVPDPADPAKVRVVFSDSLEPDKNVNIEKIADTKLTLYAGGRETALTMAVDKDKGFAQLNAAGDGPRVIAGETDYGVFQRGDAKPAWLTYYPKAILGGIPPQDKATIGEKLPVEIVPVTADGKLRFLALAKGKPLANAELTVSVPGEEKAEEVKADGQGVSAKGFDKPGVYAVRFKQTDATAGTHKGMKYEQVTRYATLVVSFGK